MRLLAVRAALQLADYGRAVRYEISLPPAPPARMGPGTLYVHASRGRRGRELDNATERFVEETRLGAAE
jgi:hypothetical protein